MERRSYTVVLLKERDGRYSVSVPALDGCFTWGRNLTHALAMAAEAIALYLEVLEEDHRPLPPDTESFTAEVGEATEITVRKVTVGEARAVA